MQFICEKCGALYPDEGMPYLCQKCNSQYIPDLNSLRIEKKVFLMEKRKGFGSINLHLDYSRQLKL